MSKMWSTYDKSLKGEKMKSSNIKNESSEIKKIRKFLDGLGFTCSSYPSAQNLVYSKNGDTIIIKK